MDFQKDYYGILGCTADADQAVIQAAYRALAKKYHPDANQGSNESKEKFQEIQEAYETLSDPTKRAYYDAMRSGGLVAYLCRSDCSFRLLGVRKPGGFCLPTLNACGADYRSR